MLITTCTQCGARFRVTPEQLNVRHGKVRCGECQAIFSGFETLERVPGDDTGARLLASRGMSAPAAEADDFQPRDEPGWPGTLEPLPALPDSPEQVTTATPELREAATDDDDAVSAPPAAPPATDAQKAAPEEAAPEEATAEPASPEPMLRPPSFGTYRAQPRTAPYRAWALGATLLVLVLGLQLTYAFRANLAHQYPVLRPILESACASAGCVVPWKNDENALRLEDSELIEVPGKAGQIALQARIRNLSPAAQQYPHIELTLTDVGGQTAIRRVLRPSDYLGRLPAPTEAMASGSETMLSIRLETDRIKPTGYELLLFYP